MTDSNTTPVGQTFHIVITCADGLEIPLQTELASFGIDTQIERTGRLIATLTLAVWGFALQRESKQLPVG